MVRPRILITAHAVARFRERIGGTEAEARAVLSSPAVVCAAEFGARVVRIERGRIVMVHTPQGVRIITVLPLSGLIPRSLRPVSLGGPMPIAAERATFAAPSPQETCPCQQTLP